MGKTRAVTATQDQWQWVTWFTANFAMPDTVGAKEYKPIERARIQEEITAVYDALAARSYYMTLHGQENRTYFGDKEDWTEDTTKPGEFKATKPEKSYTLELGERAVSGLVWLFTVLLTPPERKKGPDGKEGASHPYMVTPALAGRFIWPIVKQMGKVVAVKRSVGIEEAPLRVWEEDESPEVAR